MKSTILISLLSIALIISCSCEKEIQPSRGIQEFPLSKGAYWVYQGNTKWTKRDLSGEVIERTLTWKMEVVDTITRGHVYAAVLKGHPGDLNFYHEGKEPGDYLIIRVGREKYYILDGKAMKRPLGILRREGNFLGGLVRESQLFLDLPLNPGKVFGESGHVTRQDRSYCWFVENEQPVELKEVKGISSKGKMFQYRLVFDTVPWYEIIEFVLGVGITRYTFFHHGTVSETDLRLIEYHKGS